MSPRHKEQPSDLKERIIRTAWKQMAESGSAALSLRAIARELGVTAPAIYNYFPDRDALVTALIIEAYLSFGDSQLAADHAVPFDNLANRMIATGLAYRQWALTYPERYQLIFGTPIPGYVAPFEQVFPAAARSLGAIVGVVEALRKANRLQVDNFPEAEPGSEVQFKTWKMYGGEAEILSLSVAVLIWSRVHGLVSLEISGNLPPYGPQGEALYRYELGSLVKQFIRA
jgi:AcrR family transcriptional regulator